MQRPFYTVLWNENIFELLRKWAKFQMKEKKSWIERSILFGRFCDKVIRTGNREICTVSTGKTPRLIMMRESWHTVHDHKWQECRTLQKVWFIYSRKNWRSTEGKSGDTNTNSGNRDKGDYNCKGAVSRPAVFCICCIIYYIFFSFFEQLVLRFTLFSAPGDTVWAAQILFSLCLISANRREWIELDKNTSRYWQNIEVGVCLKRYLLINSMRFLQIFPTGGTCPISSSLNRFFTVFNAERIIFSTNWELEMIVINRTLRTKNKLDFHFRSA